MTKGEGRAGENTGCLFHTCSLVCGIEHHNISHNQLLCLAARCKNKNKKNQVTLCNNAPLQIKCNYRKKLCDIK